MTLQDIVHKRLIAQMIVTQPFTKPADVVRAFGAVQAQDYGQALWAIGLRTQGATRETVERAIADGTILRTWPMRGTIHFVASEDASWLLSVSAARTIGRAKSRHTGLGLDDNKLRRAGDILEEALAGKQLPRPDVMQALTKAGLDTSEQRGYHMLWYWAQLGKVCIGPMSGKQQTFALLREWAPNQRELSPGEALSELALRYFTSHGPATVEDFCTWSGVLRAEAKIAVAQLAQKLASDVFEGKTYWFDPHLSAASPADLADEYVLAGFEEYLLGYKDRAAVLDPTFSAAPTKNGVFFPIMVAHGRVVGTWKRVVAAKAITIRFEPFEPLDIQTMRRFHQKAQAYGAFMQLPIVIVT